MDLIIVGIGGFFGAVARYAVGVWVSQKWGRSFPWGTFCVNISGSFLMGLIITLFTEKLMVDARWRLFLAVGFIGTYTTFSTFEFETGALFKDGEWLYAAANVIFSVVFGFVALKVGEIMARSI